MTPTSWETLKTVAVADVYKADRLAATLRRSDGGVAFAYEPGYLDRGGRPVATTLPLSGEQVVTVAGAVPPFFAGLLPEGRRLSSLRRAVKTSADDELTLLLVVGRDAIGDVRVVPQGEVPSAVEPAVQISSDWSEVRFADVVAEGGVVDAVGLPGVQDKVSAGMISVPVARAGERFILKVDPPEYPHVVLDEAYFLGRAKSARIDVAAATTVFDADGRPGLLVRRFDRVAQPDGTTFALACEDACQVLGRWPADKYTVSYAAVVGALADRCAARPVALRRLYQQICFAWLTGNGDVHAKNLSILATPEGEWRISPAYDLPSTVPYGDRSLALSLGGRTRGISRHHLLEFAKTIGLPERVGINVLDDVLTHLEDLVDSLRDGALPFTENITIDMVKELRHRRQLAVG